MKITFLGVEGYPQGGRETISILLELDGKRILLDCGASIIGQLDRCGLSVCDINAVFVSHLHADHSSGVPLLLFGNLMERFERRFSGTGELTLIGNLAILNPLVSYCKAAYPALFGETSAVNISLLNIENNVPLKFKSNFTLECVPISHAVQGQSLILSNDKFRICYTSDTRRTETLDNYAKGSNIIICNTFGCDDDVADKFGQLSASKAAEFARDMGAKQLFMLHLPNDETRTTAKQIAHKIFNGDIETPTNGESYLFD